MALRFNAKPIDLCERYTEMLERFRRGPRFKKRRDETEEAYMRRRIEWENRMQRLIEALATQIDKKAWDDWDDTFREDA